MSQPDRGQARYALVIGAGQYRSLPVRPGYADNARSMALMAEQAGYALIGNGPLLNPNKSELRRAVDILGRLTEDGAEAFIYFAGHVIPCQGTLFLLPIDAERPPVVQYAECGMRIEEAWSHPLGRGASSTTIILETEGVTGFLGLPPGSAGTGFEALDVPDSVVVAISDRGGPIAIDTQAFHQLDPAGPRLLYRFGADPQARETIFTSTLISLNILGETNLSEALEMASLSVFERSAGLITPVIFDRSRMIRALAPRAELAPLALTEESDDALGRMADDLHASPNGGVGAVANRSGQSVVELIQMFEAFRSTTYLDAAGVPTIGFGHTGREARPGNVISFDRAIELLMEDIDTAASAVDAAVTRPLTDNQRNALISLVFNIGGEAFSNSTLLRLINSDIQSVTAAEFLRWVHARVPGVGMSPLRGLESRRQLEAFLFLVEDDGISARELVLSFEPFRSRATRMNDCSFIGYARPLHPCDQVFDLEISQIEALQYLRRELRQIEIDLRAVVDVPISESQMAALVSFVHQNGLEALLRSRIMSRLNQGDFKGAANALRLHDSFIGDAGMSLGQRRVKRRAAEAALFFADGGDYVIMNAGTET